MTPAPNTVVDPCDEPLPRGWRCTRGKGHTGLHSSLDQYRYVMADEAARAEPIPLLFCGKYQVRQGPDNRLLVSDADGIEFLVAENNLHGFIYAAGIVLMHDNLPAVAASHYGDSD